MHISTLARQLFTLISLSTLTLATTTHCAFAAKNNDSFTPEQKKAVETIVHDYIVNQPEVLVEASRTLQQRQQQGMMSKAQNAIAQNATAIFSTSSPMIGNPKGDITIVEFFDYQCIHCKEMKPIIAGLINADKNIRVIYKDFPIFGQGSQFASMAALAAIKQNKYIELHNALMNTHQPINKTTVLALAKGVGLDMTKLKTDMESSDIREQLKNTAQLAETLGLGGTPAFIVAKTNDGNVKKSVFIPGSVNGSVLQNYIDQLRKA